MCAAGLDQVVGGPEVARGAQPDVHAELAAADHQRVAHVVARVPEVAEGDLAQVLLAVLGHGEHVGQDLRRVELVGQAVPHRHAGVLREGLDVLLGGAAVLDGVEGAAEDSRGVLHRLLVADLGAAGSEVGHVRALVLRGDLERGASPRRGLLEDQGDVLAGEARLLVAGVLRGLEVGGELEQEAQLVGGEVELLEEAPVAEVEGQWRSFAQAVASTAGVAMEGATAAQDELDELFDHDQGGRDADADAPLGEAQPSGA